jgi:hypothetical protein
MSLTWFLASSLLFPLVFPRLYDVVSEWSWVREYNSRRIIAVENFRIRRGQVEAIAAIRRVPLRRRLERECGMDSLAAEIAVAEYLAFLSIAAANPNRMVAPTSGPCDEAWHAHILHTEAYDRDMRAIFGRPFHHRPADDPDEAWLAEPQLRTELMLAGFEGISNWPGLAQARADRGIPDEMTLSTAAMIGMGIAAGSESFAQLASGYRTPGGPAWRRREGGGCGGGSCGGHSCGGSSCGGSSCGGH